MKSIFHGALLATTLLAGSALAETATIDFKGTITGSTCTFTTPNGAIDLQIGSVNKSVFTDGSASDWAGSKSFTWTNCNVSLITMTFIGNADPNNPSLFEVTGGATGVGIQLAKSNTSNVRIGPNSVETVAPSGGTATYSFTARYLKSKDPVTAGQANATITVVLTYT
jgi:major type 1 subunit fimbrin (pilin)